MSRRSTRDSSPKSRLRMDSYSSSRNGRSKGTPPRNREIDSVMKKARRDGSQSAYWNKKLLEAEEKEPDRWCHSGYKELYHGGEKKSPVSSGSDSRSHSGSSSPGTRSPVRPRSPRQKTSKGKSRSPKVRSRSPKARTRSPKGRSRSPKARTRSPKGRSRTPRGRSRSPRVRSRSPRIRSRSPRVRSRSPRVRSRSPRHRSPRPRSPRGRSPKSSRMRSPRGPRSPRSPRPRSPRSPRSPRQRSPRLRSRSPRSPRRRRRSPFFRSPIRRPLSPRKARSQSCSSESSSSCSNDSCSVCAKEARSQTRDRGREHDKRRTETTRQVTRPRSRSRSMSLIQSRALDKSKSKATSKRKRIKEKSVLKRNIDGQVSRSHYIKVESDSDSSSGASQPETKGPKLSLSERFGRIAQWSVDRESEHRNLRITAGERLTVEMDSPPSPPYPPSLSSIGDLGSWDDVRVRYTYYKEHGYLRDLTLQDYIKWEQWWYKYQDWLDNERYYDRYNPYRRRP